MASLVKYILKIKSKIVLSIIIFIFFLYTVYLPLVFIPLTVAVVTQFMKLIIDYYHTRSFKLSDFWTAGGFPSVHSSMSASIITIVLRFVWPYSIEFAIAMTFARLFRYDAINVRYEAGVHAKYINEIRLELKDLLSIQNNIRHLKERLWHTLSEVLGGIFFGILLTLICIFGLQSCIYFLP